MYRTVTAASLHQSDQYSEVLNTQRPMLCVYESVLGLLPGVAILISDQDFMGLKNLGSVIKSIALPGDLGSNLEI